MPPSDLRPLIQSDVGSKTLGHLDAVLVDRGDARQRGKLLALGPPSICPTSSRPARSTLAQAQSATALARTNYERAKQLGPEAVSFQQELQQAESQFTHRRGGEERRSSGPDRGAGGASGETRIELAG